MRKLANAGGHQVAALTPAGYGLRYRNPVVKPLKRTALQAFCCLSALTIFLAPALAEADDAVQRLEAQLMAAPSATQFLTGECARLKLASPAVIHAVRDKDMDVKAGSSVRKLLEVGSDARLGYRRVKLVCGRHVLSEADNWYVPDRLTPEMNHALDTTDVPFGAVVKPLNFHRKTIKMEALADPAHDLRVTALLADGNGKPFSVVIENYSRALTANPR
jgi:hypothetical protein